ncbi:hypothetical protein [Paenibacillus larvae]|uniref:hypothetical protein n=1 Tax=Paenibacillus larvae TaxID=1464 RepID=UPI00288E618E|nr:hypothetical protein [Paenibacillus larvae]MDT2234685.1 hypothetical protein [Paenibacillus larvae]
MNGSSHSVDLATMVKMLAYSAALGCEELYASSFSAPSQIKDRVTVCTMLRDGQKGQLNPALGGVLDGLSD